MGSLGVESEMEREVFKDRIDKERHANGWGGWEGTECEVKPQKRRGMWRYSGMFPRDRIRSGDAEGGEKVLEGVWPERTLRKLGLSHLEEGARDFR